MWLFGNCVLEVSKKGDKGKGNLFLGRYFIMVMLKKTKTYYYPLPCNFIGVLVSLMLGEQIGKLFLKYYLATGGDLGNLAYDVMLRCQVGI